MDQSYVLNSFGRFSGPQYRLIEFRDDMKVLFEKAGIDNKPTTFLFNDTQVKDEKFLEDINNVLNAGEVPNLYAKDEIPGIFDGVRKRAAHRDPTLRRHATQRFVGRGARRAGPL